MKEAPKNTAAARWREGQAPSEVVAVICDLNGVYRGKRYPGADLRKIMRDGLKMPLSTLFLDIWGRDVMSSGLVLETGDYDGVLTPTGPGPLSAAWRSGDAAFVPLWMSEPDGAPCDGDPRRALAAIIDQCRDGGLTPVAAMELEFHLYRPAADGRAPRPGLTAPGSAISASDLYSIDALDAIEPFLTDLRAACDDLGIKAGAAVSEGGRGQFEINLDHRTDALRAADDVQFLKVAVKGVARKHGVAATFMAKPFGDDAGNGLHTHVNVLDRDGGNIFDESAPMGGDQLRRAIGGLQAAMTPSMLIFAPHANSYRRLRPETHAPTTTAWGFENRTTALRIPDGPAAARRIEHRVAGADANPYLVMAAILGGMMHGLKERSAPDDPVEGNAYQARRPSLPASWREAIIQFETSSLMRDVFGERLVKAYAACKKQELHKMAEAVPLEEHEAYLETV